MKSPGLNFSAKSGDQRFDSAIDDFALLLVRLVALLIQNVHAFKTIVAERSFKKAEIGRAHV